MDNVIMMAVLALPAMIERGYAPPLATGAIAASGTLGILIPPSIMLVIMADLLGRSVGNLFQAALLPGLLLAGLYFVYVIAICWLRPRMAPALPDSAGPQTASGYVGMILRSFLPPVLLVTAVLGSILGGFATPTEAVGIGAAGAVILAFYNLVIQPAAGGGAAQMQAVATEGVAVRVGWPRSMGALGDFYRVSVEVMESAALTNAMVFGIFVGATIFSLVFRALGVMRWSSVSSRR